ncbi:MAG: hypothetical protein IJC04_02575 [Oscillospiraceae bacterium]|nr:hypothetical protein [Oscillospiraceae bacterium]
MKLKKIVAAIAAAAMAVTMTAVNTFALSIGEYPGDWGATGVIPKAEFAAIGGDVKVTLDVEHKAPLVGDINALLKPMNICVSWDQLTWTGLTSDTAYAKGDGFIVVPKDCTTIEFVVPESVWSTFVDYEGGESEQAGMAFQVCHVNIKNVTLSAGAPEGEFKQVSEEESADLMKNGAPAAEAAPAADSTTTSTETGNAPVAAMAVVMALAGTAAVVAKKRN